MTAAFPIYFDHDAAAFNGCKQCGKPFAPNTWNPSLLPRGEFVLRCPECDTSNYYDVEEHTP